jgi:hypothetical protein
MTYLFNNQVGFAVPFPDASFRLRVSNPLTLFEHNNQYGTSAFKWDKQTSGTGTITDTTATSSTVLATGGTASGAGAIRQSRVYWRYQVEKSLLHGHAFNFGTGVTGVVKRIGYYDSLNGVYIQQNGATISLGFRQNGTDTLVAQSSWNVDTMNGTGPSGQTFNPADTQALVVDQLGTLSFRFYLIMNFNQYLVHEYTAANISGSYAPYTANLTSRAEITNTTTVASSSTFTVGNVNIVSEGAQEEAPSYNFGASNGITTRSVGTAAPVPVFSLQAKTLGPDGVSRNYGQFRGLQYNIYASAAVYLQFIVNGTLTGATFTSAGSNSIVQYDVAATAISGGTTIDANFVTPNSTGGGATGEIANPGYNRFPYVYSSLLNTQDTISVTAMAFTATANVSVAAVWTEFY